MKDRIIDYLSAFSRGQGEDLAREIREETGLNEHELMTRSAVALSNILHHYSQFSISTIDAFFQKVIRAFTREAGLLGNFRLEAETEPVLQTIVADLIDELGEEGREQLTEWVVRFAQQKLTEGENWNLTGQLMSFAEKVLFEDSFKLISAEIQEVQRTVGISTILKQLNDGRRAFFEAMQPMGREAIRLIHERGFTSQNFAYGEQGTPYKFFKQFAAGHLEEVGKRILEGSTNAAKWQAAANRRSDLHALIEKSLMPLLNRMLELYDKESRVIRTIDLILDNFYSYGLIGDLTRKLKDYQAENNVMLLSDAAFFLNGVIRDSDTPFVYEKIGSFYRHYLIDEFQDTSELQWRNFRPLLLDSLDQGHRGMVVGDVKQSIYRWRGGDQSLLQETIVENVGTARAVKHELNENWRSAENLVRFNNALFERASSRVAEVTGHPIASQAFAGLTQIPRRHIGQGYVKVGFFQDDDVLTWNEQALVQVPDILEQIQDAGVSLNDIAILVRENKEGQMLATYMLNFQSSGECRPGYRYDVVSNESLKIDAAGSVLLLLSALKYLANPDDDIARGELVYYYMELIGRATPEESERRMYLAGRKELAGLVPEELVSNRHSLVKLSLFELTETLVRHFGLNRVEDEVAYIESFQDLVLEFASSGRNDIASFLTWWKTVRGKRSITVASHSPAASIYTIHKAKGLQFKWVIVPFCGWLMNHKLAPILWCKTNVSPFDSMGPLAVRYGSELNRSLFAPQYEEERTKIHVDNLNLLYVALTRAREGMIIMAPRPKSMAGDKINNVGQLLYESIHSAPDLNPDLNTNDGIYEKGVAEVLSPDKGQTFHGVHLSGYSSVDWRQRLVIRREGAEFFNAEPTEQRKKINYGILMHRVLSHIHYASDIANALTRLHLEGVIVEDELEPLRNRLNKMMEHPQIGTWYSTQWTVRTELPVIIPGGSQDRLDRVNYKEVSRKGQKAHKAIIIDYKTGRYREDDRKQVEAYARALLEMGYVDVEGFLLYLETLEVVPVVSKSSLSLPFGQTS